MRIRLADEADLPAMARVNVDTRRATHLGFYPAELLMALSYERTEVAWRKRFFQSPSQPGQFALVAEDKAGCVVGIAIAGPEASQDVEYTGEIYVLYVLPQQQQHGIGRRLVAEAVRRLAQAGHTRLLIWTLAENPACGFYERLGGKRVRTKTVETQGYLLKEVGFGWMDLHELILEAERGCDGKLEWQFLG